MAPTKRVCYNRYNKKVFSEHKLAKATYFPAKYHTWHSITAFSKCGFSIKVLQTVCYIARANHVNCYKKCLKYIFLCKINRYYEQLRNKHKKVIERQFKSKPQNASQELQKQTQDYLL